MIELCVDIESTGLNFFRMKNFFTKEYEPEDFIISVGFCNDDLKSVVLGSEPRGFEVKAGVADLPLGVKYALACNEREILEKFLNFFDGLEIAGTPKIVGYNIKKFDVPFLFYKSVKYGLELGRFRNVIKGYYQYHNPYLADAYDFLRFNIYNNNFPLVSVLESWGIKGKFKDYHGGMARYLTKQDLRKYNAQDVEIEWLLHKKLKEVGVL